MGGPRWRVGRSLGRTLYRDNLCVGMVDSPEVAAEVVAALNGASVNDREFIVAALRREANRVFKGAPKDYPSNVLDAVAWNLMTGETELLIERKHPGGHGMETPGDPQEKGQP